VYLRQNPENIIETDHMPNIYFTTKPNLSSREVRWMETLSAFPGKWMYKPGKGNIADPLSRMPTFYNLTIFPTLPDRTVQQTPEYTLSRVLFTILPKPTDLGSLKSAYLEDPTFQREKYEERDGIYFTKDGKIAVPKVQSVRDYIISQHHDTIFAGHMGRDKTANLVSRYFAWDGLHKDVAQYVKECPICQTTKPSPTGRHGELLLPEISPIPWRTISLDFVTGLPLTT